MAFLSLLDDRARPKGSRDPLGFEMVWTHLGRKVVGNLTTITSSLGNFATALVGFAWAHEHSAGVPVGKRHLHVQDLFLKYEQLAAYLRRLGGDYGIMGITRVRRRLEDGEDAQTISFGPGPEQQILSDQASYGLWGLYSTALRDTGLVKGDDREPTEKGRAIAEEIRKHFDQGKWMDDVLLRESGVTVEDLLKHASAFVKAIRHKSVQTQLKRDLLTGNATHALQKTLWEVTQNIDLLPISDRDLSRFIQVVKDRLRPESPGHAKLAKSLEDIRGSERLLVAANNLFHYCRRKDAERFENVVAEIRKRRYSYAHLPSPEDVPLPGGQYGRDGALLEILRALRDGDHHQALRLILQLNRDVMKQRGGAPWVEIENGDTLRVRVKNERAKLRNQNYIETHWEYDYFLGSFLRIAKETMAVSAAVSDRSGAGSHANGNSLESS